MFESAFLKVKRAQKHISDLECSLSAYMKRCPYILPADADPNDFLGQIEFSENIPSDIPLIIGDAIHNLRSSLDHATWELLGFDGGKQDKKTAFPFCEGGQAEYKAKCEGIETPRSDTNKFFIAFSAHPGGSGEKLYRLHQLDIIDKHRKLTPTIRIISVDMEVTYEDGQVRSLNFNLLCEGPDDTSGVIHSRGGERISVKLDQNRKIATEIFIRDIDILKDIPLIETLKGLSDTIEDTIGHFREFVLTRP